MARPCSLAPDLFRNVGRGSCGGQKVLVTGSPESRQAQTRIGEKVLDNTRGRQESRQSQVNPLLFVSSKL